MWDDHGDEGDVWDNRVTVLRIRLSVGEQDKHKDVLWHWEVGKMEIILLNKVWESYRYMKIII